VYSIVFDKKVLKDFKKIDSVWQKRIVEKIEDILVNTPYEGKKLVGNMSNFYRLRVGDYRIVYEIIEDIVTIEIIKVAHRKEVY
jgi:mRNA interferase RelE/StbE